MKKHNSIQHLLSLLAAFSIAFTSGCFVTKDFGVEESCFFGTSENDVNTCRIPLEIAAGGEHSCIIRADQTVACWGSNEFGQLGVEKDGFRVDAVHYPLQVPTLGNTSQISAGHRHTCAIDKNEETSIKRIYCWGDNRRGQTGRTPGDDSQKIITLPKIVTTTTQAKSWSQVSAGGHHTCAISAEDEAYKGGEVFCWGDNSLGQVDGEKSESFFSSPQKKEMGSTSIVGLSSGLNHTCAHNGENIFCWGNPSSGKTGHQLDADSGTYKDADQAIQVPRNWSLGTTIIDISAGREHSCALIDNGAIHCWGSSELNQLSPIKSETSTNTSPNKIKFGTDMNRIIAGRMHTCVLGKDKQVYCWGGNQNYQLGDGTDDDRLDPAKIKGEYTNLARIAVGGEHACALRQKTGEILCWGLNEFGQAGQEFESESQKSVKSPTPLTIPDPKSSSAKDAGTSLPPRDSGVTSTVADAGMGIDAGTVMDAEPMLDAEVDAGSSVSMDSGNVEPDADVWPDAGPPPDSGVWHQIHDISISDNHSCAIVGRNRQVYCWGYNTLNRGHLGSLATGAGTSYPDPVEVPGQTNYSALTLGSDVSCGIKTDGTLWCWGMSRLGHTAGSTAAEVNFTVGTGTVSDACQGHWHMCAIRNGDLYCWGENTHGQVAPDDMLLGRTKSPQPVSVANLSNQDFVELACGAYHTCARRPNGDVYCWGMNAGKELGRVSSTQHNSPELIINLEPSVNIEAGEQFTCSQRSDGAISCWGSNLSNQLGSTGPSTINCALWDEYGIIGGRAQEFSAPAPCTESPQVVVSSGKNLETIGYEALHACATDRMQSTSGAQCWGGNDRGQLGNGASMGNSSMLQTVQSGSNFTYKKIVGGRSYTCAITMASPIQPEENRLYCWGVSTNGAAGWSDTMSRTNPQLVVFP